MLRGGNAEKCSFDREKPLPKHGCVVVEWVLGFNEKYFKRNYFLLLDNHFSLKIFQQFLGTHATFFSIRYRTLITLQCKNQKLCLFHARSNSKGSYNCRESQKEHLAQQLGWPVNLTKYPLYEYKKNTPPSPKEPDHAIVTFNQFQQLWIIFIKSKLNLSMVLCFIKRNQS